MTTPDADPSPTAEGRGRRLPMFPLSTVLLPHAPLPLHVFEQRYRDLVADCLETEEPSFGVVLISRGSEVGGGDERVEVGTVANIVAARALGDGRWAILALGAQRIRVTSWLGEDRYPQAIVEDIREPVPLPPGSDIDAAEAAVRRARALLSEIGEDTGAAANDLVTAEGPLEPEAAVWRLCALAPVPVSDRQRLLEAPDHRVRLGLLRELCDDLAADVTQFLSGRS